MHKYKPGNIVAGRIIVAAYIGRNFAGLGRVCNMYSYRFVGEPESAEPLHCSEATLIRRA